MNQRSPLCHHQCKSPVFPASILVFDIVPKPKASISSFRRVECARHRWSNLEATSVWQSGNLDLALKLSRDVVKHRSQVSIQVSDCHRNDLFDSRSNCPTGTCLPTRKAMWCGVSRRTLTTQNKATAWSASPESNLLEQCVPSYGPRSSKLSMNMFNI